MDGTLVQTGTIHWTYAAAPYNPQAGTGQPGSPIYMDFVFDPAWGNNRVGWDDPQQGGVYTIDTYSRVYLRA